MPYLAVFRMRFLLMLQYRAAAIAGFATQCWWGLLKVMVFAAFYRSRCAHQPINLAHAVTYTWLGQAFLRSLPWNADPEVAGDGAHRRRSPTIGCARSTHMSGGTCARWAGCWRGWCLARR